MREAFPSGLESPLLLSHDKGSKMLRPPIVQIHHDAVRQHWVTSCAVRGRVEVCDSLRKNAVSEDVVEQLITSYAALYAEGTLLPFDILPTQQQVGMDCGLHAVASSTSASATIPQSTLSART